MADELFTPTHRQIVLARVAIEAAFVYHLQAIGRYAINKRVAVVVTPPDGMAVYEGARALAMKEASVSDWQGDDTHKVQRADLKEVPREEQIT